MHGIFVAAAVAIALCNAAAADELRESEAAKKSFTDSLVACLQAL